MVFPWVFRAIFRFEYGHDFNLMNAERLMWANDFPHSDSTWPWSQELLAEHGQDLTPEQRERVLYRNVKELYGIEL